MAKLADALASGASDRKVLGVQVPLRAQKFLASRGFPFRFNPATTTHHIEHGRLFLRSV
jgi:hypothetical protein